MGTFHSFGLEVLRRFGEKIGLTGDIKLLDTLDAVTLLENHLAELKLDVLDNLYNPAIHLGGILGQIGRAKDELCPPERYAELCAAMRAPADAAAAALHAQIQAAGSDRGLKGKLEEAAKRQEQAAKAAEVAHCYGVYERLLREGGYLDFGDLISRTVELLEGHPDVLAALQAEYPHVLADEYQDVNRACARLVRLLAGRVRRPGCGRSATTGRASTSSRARPRPMSPPSGGTIPTGGGWNSASTTARGRPSWTCSARRARRWKLPDSPEETGLARAPRDVRGRHLIPPSPTPSRRMTWARQRASRGPFRT